MLKYQKITRKNKTIYRIFINRGYGYTSGNMLEALSGEIQKENWIEVERKAGQYFLVDENLTDKKGYWVYDNTELGFVHWDEEVLNLDNMDSDEAQCFDISNKLKWNEVILNLNLKSFRAKSIERLCEALEHVTINSWCAGDI